MRIREGSLLLLGDCGRFLLLEENSASVLESGMIPDLVRALPCGLIVLFSSMLLLLEAEPNGGNSNCIVPFVIKSLSVTEIVALLDETADIPVKALLEILQSFKIAVPCSKYKPE